MTTVIIIQARMTSKRLPGKMMMDIAGKPMLQRVIERTQRAKRIDKVACCFPYGRKSNPMADLCYSLGVPIFFGSEDDVLDRYYVTAANMNADIIVRVTGDCPLIDPEVIDKAVKLRSDNNAQYASNVWPRSFPKGLDVEVFTRAMLEKANDAADDQENWKHDHEHVTPWMVRNAKSRWNLASGRFNLARINWSVDTLDDLARVRGIYASGEPTSLDEALTFAERSDFERAVETA